MMMMMMMINQFIKSRVTVLSINCTKSTLYKYSQVAALVNVITFLNWFNAEPSLAALCGHFCQNIKWRFESYQQLIILCSSLNTEGAIQIAHWKSFSQFTLNDIFKISDSALGIHRRACINMQPVRSFSVHDNYWCHFSIHREGMAITDEWLPACPFGCSATAARCSNQMHTACLLPCRFNNSHYGNCCLMFS